MNRKQRRTAARRTNREAVPICYLLYIPGMDGMYLAGADAEKTTLKFGEEAEAAAMPTREDARQLAEDVRMVSGLKLAIQPRYLPYYH